MLEETLARAAHFARPDRISAVIGHVHADLTERALSGKPVEILVGPRGRNTAACVGLAALHAKRVAEDEPMVVLPADHFIADVEGFTRTIRAAAEIARDGAIVTLGVAPDRPETGYGYIHIGAESGESSAQPYFRVSRFVEKPDYQTALGYLSSGDYLWNSGVFIFTARTVLQEIEACMPALHHGLTEIERAIDTSDYDATVERVYD